VSAIGHVLLSALHRTTPLQEKTAEPQIATLAFDVNEKHSQSRLDEHGVG